MTDDRASLLGGKVSEHSLMFCRQSGPKQPLPPGRGGMDVTDDRALLLGGKVSTV